MFAAGVLHAAHDAFGSFAVRFFEGRLW